MKKREREKNRMKHNETKLISNNQKKKKSIWNIPIYSIEFVVGGDGKRRKKFSKESYIKLMNFCLCKGLSLLERANTKKKIKKDQRKGESERERRERENS